MKAGFSMALVLLAVGCAGIALAIATTDKDAGHSSGPPCISEQSWSIDWGNPEWTKGVAYQGPSPTWAMGAFAERGTWDAALSGWQPLAGTAEVAEGDRVRPRN